MNYIVAVLVAIALTILCIKISRTHEEDEPVEITENPKLNEEYWQYLDVIEMEIQQLEIDHATNFISEELYESRKKDILKRLAKLKKEYLKAKRALNTALA